MLALGTWLAARGVMAVAGVVMAALGAVAFVVLAAVVGVHGGGGAASLPAVASSTIAWSAGMTLAFGAALRAVRRDRELGVVDLARARGVGLARYVRGRVGGLVLLLALTVGGATLVAGLAATTVARPSLPAARATLGALAYAIAFAATMGPVALAALGARSRAGGYVTLFGGVIALPELLAPWSAEWLPEGWHELTSIPAALGAVRAGVASPVTMGASMARALAGLTAIVAVSLFVVAARARRSDAEAAS